MGVCHGKCDDIQVQDVVENVSPADEDTEDGDVDPPSTCVICIKAKQLRQISRVPVERTKRPFELVHSDLCGPITPPSMAGARYFIVYADDYSRYSWVYFLRTKSADEVTSRFQEFQHLVERQWPDWPIKRFWCDNGRGEYDNGFFRGILWVSGISYEPSPPYTQHKKGVSERLIRTLVTKARAMMIDSRLDDPFWAEAVNTASYLHARSPSRSIGGKTPYQMLHGTTPVLNHLRRFGCIVYNLIPKELRVGKFAPRSVECVFVGYVGNTAKIWRLWNPDGGQLGRIVHASDVHFDESRVGGKCLPELSPTAILDRHLEPDDGPVAVPRRALDACDEVVSQGNPVITEEVAPTGPISLPRVHPIPGPACVTPSHVPTTQNISGSPPVLQGEPEETVSGRLAQKDRVGSSRDTWRQEGIRRPEVETLWRSRRLGGMARANTARVESTEVGDPISYREALAHECAREWEDAIREELGSLRTNETWDLVDASHEMKLISCKWVFRTKMNHDGSKRFKARLVVRGYEQTDYGETYAPVASLTTFRLLVALTAIHRWELDHMDVVTAFLNPRIKGDTYMKPPEGLKVTSAQKVCKLKKALYGLKEAPRLWNEHINTFLYSIGFTRSMNDSSLYTSWNGRNPESRIFILLYVDDLLLASPSRNAVNRLKALLSQKYRMTDLGQACQFLNINIDRSSMLDQTTKYTTIRLSQERFIMTVLKRFQMEACNGTVTPIDTVTKAKGIQKTLSELNNSRSHNSPEPPQDVCDENQKSEYQSLVGSLMYLMTATRPDLSYTISVLSKFNSSPTMEHLLRAKRVLRYIQQTKQLVLTYTSRGGAELISDKVSPHLRGFSDSDWAGDLGDRKSTSGYIFTMHGTAIAWRSRKQTMVALSSTEAEYIGYSDAVKDGLFFQRLLDDFIVPSPNTLQNKANKLSFAKSTHSLPSDTIMQMSLSSTAPLLINMDNQSAIYIASNSRPNQRTKHIDIRHHHVKEMIAGRHILLRYVPTADMTADIMTKALPKEIHQWHVEGMGLR